MAFDPTKPVEDSPLDAAEVRDQLNALKALIDALQSQVNAMAAPVLTRDAATGLWNITCAGPPPSQLQVWKRCDYAPAWATTGVLELFNIPAHDDCVLAEDEVWWQIKFVGVDGDGKPVTPVSNVISSSNVPS